MSVLLRGQSRIKGLVLLAALFTVMLISLGGARTHAALAPGGVEDDLQAFYVNQFSSFDLQNPETTYSQTTSTSTITAPQIGQSFLSTTGGSVAVRYIAVDAVQAATVDIEFYQGTNAGGFTSAVESGVVLAPGVNYIPVNFPAFTYNTSYTFQFIETAGTLELRSAGDVYPDGTAVDGATEIAAEDLYFEVFIDGFPSDFNVAGAGGQNIFGWDAFIGGWPTESVVFGSPTLVDNSTSHRHNVEFSGNNDEVLTYQQSASSPASNDSNSFYAVIIPDSATNGTFYSTSNTSEGVAGHQAFEGYAYNNVAGQLELRTPCDNGCNTTPVVAPFVHNNEPFIVNYSWTAGDAFDQYQVFVNGAELTTTADTNVPTLPTGGFEHVTIGGELDENGDIVNEFDGKLAIDMAQYRANHSGTTDHQVVTSYLALRQGITLDPTGFSSYLDGDASNMFTYQNGYEHHVVMIGTGSQVLGNNIENRIQNRIMRSAHSGAFLTAATGPEFDDSHNEYSQPTGAFAVGEAIVIASDNGATALQTGEVDTGVYQDRLTREWRFESDRNMPTYLKFDGLDSEYFLLVDDDGDFSSGASAVAQLDDNGVVNYEFLGAGYFTLARENNVGVNQAPVLGPSYGLHGSGAQNLGNYTDTNSGNIEVAPDGTVYAMVVVCENANYSCNPNFGDPYIKRVYQRDAGAETWSQVGTDYTADISSSGGNDFIISPSGTLFSSHGEHVIMFDGSDWVSIGSTPSATSNCSNFSLSADSNDNLALACNHNVTVLGQTETRVDVHYYDGTSWSQLVDDLSYTEGFQVREDFTQPKVAFDGSDVLHVAAWECEGTFCDDGFSMFTYDGSSFNKLGTSQGNSSSNNSPWSHNHDIQFDSTDAPVICAPYSGYMQVRRFNGTDWELMSGQTAGTSSAQHAGSMNCVVDPTTDEIYVTYSNWNPDGQQNEYPNYAAVVRHYNGSSWSTLVEPQPLPTGDTNAQYYGADIELDGTGAPLVIARPISTTGNVSGTGSSVYELAFVKEIVENNTDVGIVAASDPNVGDTLTWSITGGVDAGFFVIDSATGQLDFDTIVPDYENPDDDDGDNNYIIEITVSDGNLTDVETYTIRVLDDPELDTDGDGVLDTIDIDDDNDGLLDTYEQSIDFGSQGYDLDLDIDNDGIPDNIEAQTTQDYIAPNNDDAATYDANVGLNSAYLAADGSGGPGLTPVNTDGDSQPDIQDTDSDGDFTQDRDEAGFSFDNTDTDDDGLHDSYDPDPNVPFDDVNGLIHDGSVFTTTDSDNDMFLNGSNASPTAVDFDWRDDTVTFDQDKDGVDDGVDVDSDNDGIIDTAELFGCSLLTNGGFNGPNTGYGSPTAWVATPSGETFYPYDIPTTGIRFDPSGPGNSAFGSATYGNPQEGTQGHALGIFDNAGSTYSGTLRQQITVVGGTTYDLSFYQAGFGETHALDTVGTFKFFVDGVEIFESAPTIANTSVYNANLNWVQQTTTYTPATSGTFNLDIVPIDDDPDNSFSVPGGALSIAIDNISFALGGCSDDPDGDGYLSHLDLDSDGDGIPDNVEAQTTQDYVIPDGVYNAVGIDTAYTIAGGYATDGIVPVDTDTDGDDDMFDDDSDDDLTNDVAESGLTLTSADSDDDGLDDGADASIGDGRLVHGLAHDGVATFLLDDTDNDTLPDGTDAAPTDFDLDYRDDNSGPSLSYSAVPDYPEAAANDGSVDNANPIVITLNAETFTGVAGDDLVALGKVAVGGPVPAGLTAVLTLDSATQATLTFTNSANDHEDVNDLADLTFVFDDTAFTGGDASAVANSGSAAAHSSGIGIDFEDAPSATFNIVKNVTNDNTGSAGDSDFTFEFDDAHTGGTTIATIVGGASGSVPVTGSVVHIFELNVANYAFVDTTCTDSGGATVYTGDINSSENYDDTTNGRRHVAHFTPVDGETYTCTVANDDVPDTTPPPDPVDAPDLIPADDSAGTADDDDITNVNTPTFDVECTEAGATINLYSDAATATNPVGTHTCIGTGTEQVTVTNPLPDGPQNITYDNEDPAGNNSAASPPLSVTIDTMPPSAPTVDGPSDGDTISDPTPNVNGSGGTPGDIVTVGGPNGETCTAIVDAAGDWNCDLDTDLPEGGPHTLTVVIDDPAGNATSPPTTLDVTVDLPKLMVEFANTVFGDAAETSSPQTISFVVSGLNTIGLGDQSFDMVISDSASLGTTEGADYTAGPVTVTVPEADYTIAQVLTANVEVLDDALIEPQTENADLSLSAFSALIESGDADTSGTTQDTAGFLIRDDDQLVVEFSSATYTSVDEATAVTITLDISGADATNEAQIVAMAITGGTATNGADYDMFEDPFLGGIQVNIPAADYTAGGTVDVTFVLLDDLDVEGNETVDLQLVTAPVNDNIAIGTQGASQLTIVDDEDATPPPDPVDAPDLIPADDSAGTADDDDITNVNTPTFDVECTEAGATINLYSDAATATNPVGTHTCIGTGTEQVTVTNPLPDGPQNITYDNEDPAGNNSAASPPLSVTIDTMPPSAPTVDGPSDGDTISDPTPNVNGSGGTPGDIVTVGGPNGETCTAIVQADGSWSCDLDTDLPEGGPHTLTVSVEDPAGNTSGTPTTLDVTVDLPDLIVEFANTIFGDASETDTAAGSAVITLLVGGIDTTGLGDQTFDVIIAPTTTLGMTTGDDYTAGPLTVTIPEGDYTSFQTFDVTFPGIDDNIIEDAIENVDLSLGNFSNRIGAGDTDASGTTQDTAGLTVRDDDQLSVEFASATYTSVDEATAVTITFNVTGAEATTSQFFGMSITGGTATNGADYNMTIDPFAGGFPVSIPAADYTSGGTVDVTFVLVDDLIEEGPETAELGISIPGFTATVTAGVVNTATLTITDDDSFPPPDPSIAPDLIPADDSAGTADDDDITNVNTPTFDVECTEAGATVNLMSDDASVTNPVGTHVCAGVSTEQVTVSSPLPDGPHSITYTLEDPEGNVSAASPPLAVTIDTMSPSAPTVDAPSNGDETNDPTPTVEGSGGDEDDIVTVTGPNGETCTATVQADGTWSCELDTALPEGPATLTVTTEDPAGNTSGTPTTIDITVDLTPPTTLTVDGPVDESTINDPTPTVEGSGGDEDDIVTVTGPNGETCTATVQADGTWSCDLDTSLPENGPHALSITVEDPAGNEGPTEIVEVTIDTSAPGEPNVDGPVDGSTINDPTPTVFGSGGTPGDTMIVTGPGPVQCEAAVLLDGTWACELDGPLAEGGPHTLTVVAEDPVGNLSPPETLDVTIDTGAPADPSAPDLIPADDSGPADDDDYTSNNTPTFTVECTEDGDIINISSDDASVTNPIATHTCVGTGTVDVPIATTLPDGPHNITYTIEDPYGNVSAPSPSLPVTIDTTAPSSPTVDGPSDGDTIIDPTPIVEGSGGDEGDVVTVTGPNGETCTATVQADGTWSCELDTALPTGGPHTLTVGVEDPAGNTSGTPTTIGVTIDPNPDTDGDGILDVDEDLDGDGDPSNDDSDGDGTPNYLDDDDDNDGIPTIDEDLNGDGDYSEDTDGDGLPNYLDDDDDGDGVPTAQEDSNFDGSNIGDDFDGDGTPDYLDDDDDNDGIPTIQEISTPGGDPRFDDIDNDILPNYLDDDEEDSDGISTAQENSIAPNGDGNGDGVLDGLQSYVATNENPVTGAHTSLEIDSNRCALITGFNVVAESSLPTQDPGVDYPVGLNDFTLDCGFSGASTTLVVYYDKVYDTSSWVYKKYDAVTNSYRDISSIVTYGTADVNGTTVTTASYLLVDGGANDGDGIANGIIVDPAGPGVDPEELSETGTSIIVTMGAGLAILSAAGAMSVGSQRKKNSKK